MKKRRLLYIGLSMLMLVLASGALYKLIYLGFTEVTFTNHKNQTFQLQFYRQSFTRPTSEAKLTSVQLPEGSSAGQSTQLVSRIKKQGKAPLVLTLYRIDGATSGICKEAASKVMSVDIKALNTTMNLCTRSPDDKKIIYIGSAKVEGGYLVAIFTQDIDFGQEDRGNVEKARAAVDSADLSVYNPEIEKILSSIKVQ